jgi:hypothetical protein
MTNSALGYEPKCGGRGGGELRGLIQCVQLYTGAQINIGDLTSYLTYGAVPLIRSIIRPSELLGQYW